MNFYVGVTNQFNSATQYTSSTKSGILNVLYQIDCTPTLNTISDFIELGMSYATPYTVFVASATINYPTYCKFTSFTLLDSTGSLDLSSTTTPF